MLIQIHVCNENTLETSLPDSLYRQTFCAVYVQKSCGTNSLSLQMMYDQQEWYSHYKNVFLWFSVKKWKMEGNRKEKQNGEIMQA